MIVHSYHAHTTKMDTARVEKQTYVCTEKKSDAVPSPKPGVVSKLGNWKSPKEMNAELNEKFKGCMKGMERILMHAGRVRILRAKGYYFASVGVSKKEQTCYDKATSELSTSLNKNSYHNPKLAWNREKKSRRNLFFCDHAISVLV